MTIKPDFPWWFYYNIWETLVKVNKLDRVIELYQNLLKISANSEYYMNLAEAFNRLGNIPAAITNYQEVSQSYQLETQPTFAIIGTLRSGTTSLYQYLCQHPQILPAIKKEVDFFSWHFSKGIDWYLSHFYKLPDNCLTGEASPSYFSYELAPERMFSALPKIKLILLLRNPVDRAISHYHHAVSFNWEHRSISEILTAEKKQIKENLVIPIDAVPLSYLIPGIYLKYVQKWLSFFPKEQLLILSSEELFSQPEKTMQQIYDFLELPVDQLPEYPNYNPGKIAKIDPVLRQDLSDFFLPYNRELEDYLGQKFDWK